MNELERTLLILIEEGDLDRVKAYLLILLREGMSKRERERIINISDTDNTTFLLKAIEEGHVDIVEFLLTIPEISLEYEGINQQPLLLAAERGYTEIVKALLKSGAFIDITNAECETPLYLAVSNNQIETAELLLSSGANPRLATTSGETALSIAIENAHHADESASAATTDEEPAKSIIRTLLMDYAAGIGAQVPMNLLRLHLNLNNAVTVDMHLYENSKSD